jgi:hypothetical protein
MASFAGVLFFMEVIICTEVQAGRSDSLVRRKREYAETPISFLVLFLVLGLQNSMRI